MLPLFLLKRLYPVPKVGEIWKYYSGNPFFEREYISYLILEIRDGHVLTRILGRDGLPFMNDSVHSLRVFMDVYKKSVSSKI